MAKRFYISRVIGDGSDFNSYRPAVADYPCKYKTIIPQNPDGTIKFSFCFVLVSTDDHAAILADPRNKGIPELSMDAQIGTLSKAVRDKMLAYFDEEGIDRTGLTLQTTMRQVLRRIGQHLTENFDENKFDIKDW